MFETLFRANDSNHWLDQLDVVLPRWAREADSETRVRAQLFVLVVAISVFAALISAGFHGSHDHTARALVSLGWIVPALGSLFVMRWSCSLQPAVHIFLAVLLAGVFASPHFSSASTTVPISAAVVPFLAAAVAGLRTGLTWTLITLGVLTATILLVLGDTTETHLATNAWALAAVCGFGTCLLEAARIRANAAAEEAELQVLTQKEQRERTQAALDDSQALLAHSFREAPSLFILADHPTNRIVDVNKSFERISGWTVDEARGRTLTELNAWVSPDDRSRLAQHMSAIGRSQDAEIQLRTKSGEVIWMLAAASIVDLGGSPHILAQGIEITDRKIAERELARHRERLESRVDESSMQLRESRTALRQQQQLASIGTLAAGVAHQINNPIGSIMASAEFALLMGDDEDRDVVQRDALRTVVAEAERCGKIVRNVLRFARQEPTARWIEDLNPLTRRTTELTSPYVAERGGRVFLDLDPKPCRARISPIEIEQVLVNLIRNAAEAFDGDSDGAGEVRISTRLLDDRIEIEVRDNGCGMKADQLANVFDPFYTTRVNEGGTGLGLSFAHGVMIDHGGQIVLHSEPSAGTRVTLNLPACSEGEATESAKES